VSNYCSITVSIGDKCITMSADNVFDLAKLYALRAGDARLFDFALAAEAAALIGTPLASANSE